MKQRVTCVYVHYGYINNIYFNGVDCTYIVIYKQFTFVWNVESEQKTT